MNDNKIEKLDQIGFIPLKEHLLLDNQKIKEMKSIYQKEFEYAEFLGPLEFFIANYGLYNTELKDEDIVKALNNIRNNLDKDISFFSSDLEYNLMMTISVSLQINRKITIHKLLLVIKYILWSIENRKWIMNDRGYFNWVANFFDLLNKEKKKNFNKEYSKLGEERGISKEQIESLKTGDGKEPLVKDIILSKLDSENFNESNNNEESLWGEGSYIQSIDSKDPEHTKKMKYFEEKPDDRKEYNCKKCNKLIGKHNLYWHEGMCNDCFFDEYNL